MSDASTAFETFMQTHQNTVFSLAMRFLNNEAEAQDIAQEVFLRAFRHFSELVASPSASAWLRTVARNLCLNHLSRYRFRWRFFSELSTDGEAESSPDNWASEAPARNDAEVSDERQVLQHALAQLPRAQRTALVLFHFENLNYTEIAAHLGISLSKVKMDIFRGRIALRNRLRRHPDEGLSLSSDRSPSQNRRPVAAAAAVAGGQRWRPVWGSPLKWCPSH
jgi:RNA polymerase sigma-70 factor, ECF subfamily